VPPVTAVTRPFPFTVTTGLVKLPTLLFTVFKVTALPVLVTSPDNVGKVLPTLIAAANAATVVCLFVFVPLTLSCTGIKLFDAKLDEGKLSKGVYVCDIL
jgi:hypothetical protein